MSSLKDLEAILEQRIAKLDEERRIHSELIAKERAEMLELAKAEREQQLEEFKSKSRAREEAAKRKAEQEESERKAALEESILKEQKYLQSEETARQYSEKLEWLTKAIAEAEFVEEQHRKAMENMRVPCQESFSADINVENPVAPLNAEHPGEAVSDTGGAQGFTSMSDHLKQILRQANR